MGDLITVAARESSRPDIHNLVSQVLPGIRIYKTLANAINAIGPLAIGKRAAAVNGVSGAANQGALVLGNNVRGLVQLRGFHDTVVLQPGAYLVQWNRGNRQVEVADPHVRT